MTTNLNPWHEVYWFYMVFLYHLILVLECELVQLKCKILGISLQILVDFNEFLQYFLVVGDHVFEGVLQLV